MGFGVSHLNASMGFLEVFRKTGLLSFKCLLTYQDISLSNVPSNLPQELYEFFQLQLGVSISDGSVEQSHIDPLTLSE